MTNSQLTVRIILGAFCLATFLGYIDYETESLYHLFTAESGGNLMAILLYTLFFTLIAWFFIGYRRLMIKFKQKYRSI